MKAVKSALETADFVLIGAGAGFSAAAGLTYSGSRFTNNFQPFIKKYGMTDMYSAAFYPFTKPEQKWAYWAKHVWHNRWQPNALPLYCELFDLVKDKNYFVLITNVDAQFEKAGFDPNRLFVIQGDYGKLQCKNACHDTLYSNESLVKQWLAETDEKTLEIPTALVPHCPKCGGEMTMHLRVDGNFVENADWHTVQARYAKFAEKALHGKSVYLELGVGFNTPAIIRYPFEQMVYHNPNALLVRLNRDYPEGFAETMDKTVAFAEDPNKVLHALL
ncbi:Sir2 family NAD-dependent protein deacetylase [Aggregatibacter aphrophilus]|uniref:Sir2 family NAD-dependent protein deacetylase n=1 Tax=Aggregatibacter aphrophilus TaxID=732 RepID=UPI001403AF14|nr:Sir2 family NAD-dependent protein deacetylase [Aggregatibacter aphrophilus]